MKIAVAAVSAVLSIVTAGCASTPQPAVTVTETTTVSQAAPATSASSPTPTPTQTPTPTPTAATAGDAFYNAVIAAGLASDDYDSDSDVLRTLGKCDPVFDDTCPAPQDASEQASVVEWGKNICGVLAKGGIAAFPEDNAPAIPPGQWLREYVGVGDKDAYDATEAARAELAVKYLCPKQAKYVLAAKSGKYSKSGPMTSFTDGDFTVGEDIKPGLYRSERKVSDCYWERTTGGGATIDNDYVTYAASGVTVRIRASDGAFSTEGCGVWTRIG